MDTLSDLRARGEAAYQKFTDIFKDTVLKVSEVPAAVLRKLSPEAERHARLAEWAKKRECEEVFLPWLESLIRQAKEAQVPKRGQHAELTYVLGVHDAYEHLKASFQSWRG